MKIKKEFAAIREEIHQVQMSHFSTCQVIIEDIQNLEKRLKILESPKKSVKPKRKTAKS